MTDQAATPQSAPVPDARDANARAPRGIGRFVRQAELRAARARVRWVPSASNAAVLALFAGVVALLLTVLVLTRIMGWHFVIVSGSSMEPTIGYGSVALIRPAAAEDLGPGDIVEFVAPGSGDITTHRIVELAPGGAAFITRGDNSFANDQAPTPFANVRGEHVLTVPFVGHIIWWLRTPLGFMAAIIVPGVLIAALEAWSTLRGYRARPIASLDDPLDS